MNDNTHSAPAADHDSDAVEQIATAALVRLVSDHGFWLHNPNGTASADVIIYIRIDGPVTETLVVQDLTRCVLMRAADNVEPVAVRGSVVDVVARLDNDQWPSAASPSPAGGDVASVEGASHPPDHAPPER